MSHVLIGHTGFVGGNLARQHTFDSSFNSANIESIMGRNVELLVIAGARAEKWKANADPAGDRRGIERLLQALERVRAERVVLVSTVDVFGTPVGVDESATVETAGLHAYGANRRLLEVGVAGRFDTLIARLPGLYGQGLKKNVLYDFLHDHDTHAIDARGVFQFYGVDRLWSDIERALAKRLTVAHLVTEPVSVHDMIKRAFDIDFTNQCAEHPARYDVRTLYAEVFGGRGGYLEGREQVLEGIATFVTQERSRAAAQRPHPR